MQVDFYQLAGTPIEKVVPQLATKVAETGERLLIVAAEDRLLDLLDEALWTHEAASFLPHGKAGAGSDAEQVVLLSDEPAAGNAARFVMLADGQWRDEALGFDRVFYLFDEAMLDDARSAWRSLMAKDSVEPRYWKQDHGRWRQGP
ncbi:DNA polymerase III subunit chi [Parasphingopyxis marina]|uniref:DNA polymerase III subunit chi n=1 Tax=Parasphingopyxis marina TaxID=2761622 RepID=A0A842I135_9SPHN|nr:DNA polymerase III subunit chi [Parasphingopyxis marina]MBC2777890.1 DNA polymerase III subunit chi [Parasphingopyxis marina]